MSIRYDVSDAGDPAERTDALRHAKDALARGQLVVVPTDTVMGLAADAFSAEAVAALLAAKGRGRSMPPPVLVADVRVLDGLARDVPDAVRELAGAHWPGALTLVCWAQPSLRWDLGETHGTVALRVPAHPLTRELLGSTGPLAVSSANLTGQPAARDAAGAQEQLRDSVAVYLDDGGSRGAGPQGGAEAGPVVEGGAAPVASTIVDATADPPRLLRAGAIDLETLRRTVPGLLDVDGSAAGETPEGGGAG